MRQIFRLSLPLIRNQFKFINALNHSKFAYTQCYYFSKMGKKKLEKFEKQKEKDSLNLSDTIDLTVVEKKFKDFYTNFQDQLVKLKVGRLSPETLDQVQIVFYGQKVSLNTLGQISSKGANVLQIIVFDETIVNEISKTLENSDLNLQIKKDGKLITCTQVGGNTKEQRLEVVKKLKLQIEQTKQNLRKIRGDGMDFIKPFKKAVSEDIIKNAEKEVEELYEKFFNQIEIAAKTKEKELMNN